MSKRKETGEERKAREKAEYFKERDLERKARAAKKAAEINPPYGTMNKANHYGNG